MNSNCSGIDPGGPHATQKSAAQKLSPFPADIRPKPMALVVASMLFAYAIFVWVDEVARPCELSRLHEDAVCLYATVTWLGTSAAMLGIGLAIAVREQTRALVSLTLPAAVSSAWVLDMTGHVAAAATGSRALNLDASGSKGDMALELAVGAMAVALMTGAVMPVRAAWGMPVVAALSGARALVMAMHVVVDAGVVEWPVVVGVGAGFIGTSATLFLIRPETIINALPPCIPDSVWKLVRKSRATMKVANQGGEVLLRKAALLKIMAWCSMMLTGGILCLPGRASLDGVTQTLALVAAALSFALIRASTLAHGRIHGAQLEAVARNSCEPNPNSALGQTLQRQPTRFPDGAAPECDSPQRLHRSDPASESKPSSEEAPPRCMSEAEMSPRQLPSPFASSDVRSSHKQKPCRPKSDGMGPLLHLLRRPRGTDNSRVAPLNRATSTSSHGLHFALGEFPSGGILLDPSNGQVSSTSSGPFLVAGRAPVDSRFVEAPERMGRAAIMLTSHGSRASVKGCDAARMELCLPALVECDAEGDCQGGRSARIAEGADDVGETVETRHRVSAGEEAPDGEVTLRLGGTPQV